MMGSGRSLRFRQVAGDQMRMHFVKLAVQWRGKGRGS